MAARAHEVKLVPHRWDMHAIQALASGDHELLRRVFTELPLANKQDCVNTKVKTFGCGAPAQFHSYGFFDSRSAPVGGATVLLEHAEEGDTLLLLALRSCDARSALVLITIGASLQEANSDGETPLRLLFQAYATIKLRDKQHLDDDSSKSQHQLQRAGSTRARDDRILSKRTEFIALFAHVQDSIDSFYAALKAKIRGELEAIYTEFAPERMLKLSTQMDDFEYNEQALLEGVRRKYLAST